MALLFLIIFIAASVGSDWNRLLDKNVEKSVVIILLIVYPFFVLCDNCGKFCFQTMIYTCNDEILVWKILKHFVKFFQYLFIYFVFKAINVKN